MHPKSGRKADWHELAPSLRLRAPFLSLLISAFLRFPSFFPFGPSPETQLWGLEERCKKGRSQDFSLGYKCWVLFMFVKWLELCICSQSSLYSRGITIKLWSWGLKPFISIPMSMPLVVSWAPQRVWAEPDIKRLLCIFRKTPEYNR